MERKGVQEDWDRRRGAAKEDADAEREAEEAVRVRQSRFDKEKRDRDLYGKVLRLGFQVLRYTRSPQWVPDSGRGRSDVAILGEMEALGGEMLLVDDEDIRASYKAFVEITQLGCLEGWRGQGAEICSGVREAFEKLRRDIHLALKVTSSAAR